MADFRSENVISAKEAKAFAVINGNVEELFYAKAIEATVEKNKVEVKVMGRRATGHKAIGWSGAGTLTIYYVTSLFRKLMLEYIKGGRDFYFDLQITNHDENSPFGRQVTALKDVNIDSISFGMFDVDGEVLEEEIPFTFEDVELLEEFQNI